MIAKLIVHGADRNDALKRCNRALHEFVIEGVKTTIPFALSIINNKDFMAGKYNTGFIEKIMKENE